jgi:hypothetical protein
MRRHTTVGPTKTDFYRREIESIPFKNLSVTIEYNAFIFFTLPAQASQWAVGVTTHAGCGKITHAAL